MDLRPCRVDNIWNTVRFIEINCLSCADIKTELLYRRIRGLLNRLTPQKFDTIISQFECLHIDTLDMLRNVVDFVFDKAVDEPIYSGLYAGFCYKVRHTEIYQDNVPTDFATLLLHRCNAEFNKFFVDDTRRKLYELRIKACPYIEHQKKLIDYLEEYDSRIRLKRVGTMKFIGQLFQKDVIDAGIIIHYLERLRISQSENHLEDICRLLTITGAKLSNQGVHLDDTFAVLENITSHRELVSKRVHFMIQDLIDLRENSWIPRRPTIIPRTIDEIEKEAEALHFKKGKKCRQKNKRNKMKQS